MNEKLSIQDMAALFATQKGCSKKEAETFIRTFFGIIEEALIREKYVKVKGLGAFKLIQVESRESVNVNTGERCIIDEHTKISFIPDTALKETVNRPFAHFETVILNENVVFDETDSEESEKAAEEIETDDEIEESANQTDSNDSEYISNDNGNKYSQETVNAQSTDNECSKSESEDYTIAVPKNGQNDTEISDEEIHISDQSSGSEINSIEPLLQEADDEPATDNAIEKSAESETIEETPITSDKAPEADRQDLAPDKPISVSKKRRLIWSLLPLVLIIMAATVYFSYQAGIRSLKKSILHSPTAGVFKPFKAPLKSYTVNKDTVLAASASADSTVQDIKPAESVEKSSSAHTAHPKFDFSKEAKDTTYEIAGTIDTYVIKEGESLVKVSQSYYGTKDLWPYIVKHNPQLHNNPDLLVAGQTINIPKLVKKTNK